MGREYFGDISGKFGFGLQSSCDIETLINITYRNEYEWHGCRCQLEEEDFNKEKYCVTCYESYEDHYQNVKDEIDENECQDDDGDDSDDDDSDDDGDDSDDNDDEKHIIDLFYETSFILYDIRKDQHYDQLIESLNNLKEKLPSDVIEEFEKIKDNENIIDGYSDIFKDVCDKFNKYQDENSIDSLPVPGINNNNNVIFNIKKCDNNLLLSFLRYKLGMQVKYVLEREDTCFMSCET